MKKKTQKKRRTAFNAVDAGILLILLAVLLVTVYFVFFADRIPFGDWTEQGERHTVTYTLELKAIDNDLLDESGGLPIVKGEILYHIDASFALGEVKTVNEASPYMAPTSYTDSKGELIYAEYPNKKNFTLTIEAEAIKADGSYVVDGKVLRIGETFTMATPYFTATAYCKDIQEVTADE